MTENLTKETFLDKVFNFEENKAWKFEGIRPVLFCPMEGQPQMANGALPKAELERIIAEALKLEKPF